MKTTTELESENADLRRMVNRLREQLTKALETLADAPRVAPVTEGQKG